MKMVTNARVLVDSVKQSALECRVQEHETNEDYKQAIQVLKEAKEHSAAYPDTFSRQADKLIGCIK